MGANNSLNESTGTHAIVLNEQRYPKSPKYNKSSRRKSNTNRRLTPSNLKGISSLTRSRSVVAKCLPQQLKTYADSIMVLSKFWCTNISPLLDNNEKNNEYQMLAMVFYTNLFKSIPSARRLFLGKDIKVQAMQYIGMIGWLITSLTKPNAKNIIKKLSKLGLDHKKRGVKYEYYPIMLNCLHEALAEKFTNEYNVRIKFCLTQLFSIISDIMIGNDFNAQLSKVDSVSNDYKLNKSVILEFITSFDDCVAHPIGLNYLELFMKQQFCIELLMFYKEYEKYRGLISITEKQKHGKMIMKKYIKINSSCEINISYESRINIKKELENNCGVFTENIFDSAVKEVRVLINTSVWTDFRKTMIDLADMKTEYRQHMILVKENSKKKQQSLRKKQSESESKQKENSLNNQIYQINTFNENDEIKENSLEFTNYDLDINANKYNLQLDENIRNILYNISNTSTISNNSTNIKSLPTKLHFPTQSFSAPDYDNKSQYNIKQEFSINY